MTRPKDAKAEKGHLVGGAPWWCPLPPGRWHSCMAMEVKNRHRCPQGPEPARAPGSGQERPGFRTARLTDRFAGGQVLRDGALVLIDGGVGFERVEVIHRVPPVVWWPVTTPRQ